MNNVEKILHAYLTIAAVAGSADFLKVLNHYEDNGHDVNHVCCTMLGKAYDKVNNGDSMETISYLLSLIN